MKKTLIIMSSGIFLTSAVLVTVWTLVLTRTAQTQDPSVDCSELDVTPWYVNNPINCGAFWYCEAADSDPVPMQCPEGEMFDEGEQGCLEDTEFSCEDTETDPTEPIETDPTEPIETDPTEPPIETDPTEPIETDPTEPIETDPTEPPIETDPTEPIETDPTEPPIETDPTEPPIETDPTEPPIDPTAPQRQDACYGRLNGSFVNDPTGCRSYFQCMNGISLPRQCDLSFNFNEELQICDRPSLTPCSNDDFECPYWGISRWEVPGSCNEFNFCIEGQHKIDECATGLVFDPEIALCVLEDEIDCTRDLCPQSGDIENIITYPHDDNCEQYYMCHGGSLELQSCAPRTHWNQTRQRCERPEDALCEVPEPIVIECPPGVVPINVPHPTICRKYFLCLNEVSYEIECGAGTLFDVVTMTCLIADQATCAEGATVRIGTKRNNYFVNYFA